MSSPKTAVLTRTERPYFVHQKALVESPHIGERTRVWGFAHVMPEAKIGSDCNICEHVFVENGAEIGNNVTVKNGVSIWSGVHVGDNVFLGPHCVFTNDKNPRAYIKKAPEALEHTYVSPNASIGANATIVCGNTIGQFAFVGAGTVVIRPVPDFALMVGNPAHQIGWMCVCASKLPIPVKLADGERCTCPHCGSELEKAPAGLALLQDNFRK